MKLTKDENGMTFTFEREQGWISLTANELSFIVNQFNKIGLRDTIEDLCREMDGDTIDLERYPYTFEEFIDEIFVDLEDEIDFGNIPSEEDIKDKIQDTANFYEMELE